MYTFLYSVKRRFSFNNVSAFVLVKVKQICSKQSLIRKNYFSNVAYVFKTKDNRITT
jgi:hypothetical protein